MKQREVSSKSGHAKHFIANSWFTTAEKTTNWFRKSSFLDNPVADCSLGTIIIHPHFVQSLAIGRIWNEITLVIYLLQGLLGRAIVFQFEHIDGCRQMEHGISPAYSTILLHLDKSTHQVEYQIEDSVEITLVLVTQTIRDTG